MITTFKVAGVSALLSAGLLTGFSGVQPRVGEGHTKAYYDRVLEGSAQSGSGTFIVTRADVPVADAVPTRSAKADRLPGWQRPGRVATIEVRDDARAISTIVSRGFVTASR